MTAQAMRDARAAHARFEARLAEAVGVHKLATDLRAFVVDHDDTLSAARVKIDDLASALECAESCEVESDLDANLTEAKALVSDLGELLTTALRTLDDDDMEATEAISDARASLRVIADELAEL